MLFKNSLKFMFNFTVMDTKCHNHVYSNIGKTFKGWCKVQLKLALLANSQHYSVSLPQPLSRAPIFAGAARRAGPDSMLNLCVFVCVSEIISRPLIGRKLATSPDVVRRS